MTYIGLIQEYRKRESSIVYVGSDLEKCKSLLGDTSQHVCARIEVWENEYNIDIISIF